MGDYALVTTAERNKDGFPKEPGRINGGFFPKSADSPVQSPSLVIAVDDIRDAMKKIKTAGGKVHGQPLDIPGYGQYVSFTDTEGNTVSIMEPSMQKPAKVKAKKSGK
jgi:predicted enzyme related to lactoylglutathione lyase